MACFAVILLPLASRAHGANSPQGQTSAAGIDPTVLARAKAGDATSQSLVGAAYMQGKDFPADYAQAAVWFGKAADQGDAKGEASLALLYLAARTDASGLKSVGCSVAPQRPFSPKRR
jgi:TPR repeat protein